jgi:pyrroline-5-carboxylate reductase
MGSALLASIHRRHPDISMILYDIDEELMKKTAGLVQGTAAASPQEAADAADAVIIAVKPQNLTELAKNVSFSDGIPVISIAAGITLEKLKTIFRRGSFVRWMPNIAATVSASIIAVTWDNETVPDWKHDALSLAECSGAAIYLPEELFSAFIGISGSGIAFMLQFIHAMALGGTREGISYQKSLKIVLETMKGAVKLAETSGTSPSELITSVTSAAGTTIEGITALEEDGMTAAVMHAVHEAARKSRNMG